MTRHQTLDWNEIEPRIRPHVLCLRDAGYATTGSCGHDMWITLNLFAADLPKLHAFLKTMNYKDFEITYSIHEGFHRYISVRIQFGGELSGDGKPFDYVLLKVDPEAHPLYFVIKARTWPDVAKSSQKDTYLYSEHTCPMNWMRDVVAVISRGDTDPHGFATFVRRADSNSIDEEEDPWIDLFPETKEPNR